MTVTTKSWFTFNKNFKAFNGYDIVVGDFIAGASDGRALQIVSINLKQHSQLHVK